MALAWPIRTDSILPLSFEAVRMLFDALNERIAAVNGTAQDEHGKWFEFAQVPAVPSIPRLSELERLREIMLHLAPKYVDFDREDYAWNDYYDFPRYYEAADLLRGEHSLAALPPPGAYEFDEDATEVYRTFVENAVWWIQRFRYAVAKDSFYAKHLSGGTRWNRISRSQPYNDPYSHEDETHAFSGNYVNPEIVNSEEGHWPVYTRQFVSAYHLKENDNRHLYIRQEDLQSYQLVKWNGFERSDYEFVSFDCYRNLNVVNKAPFAAKVLIVGASAKEHSFSKEIRTANDVSFEPAHTAYSRWYSADYSDFSFQYRNTYYGKFGGEEKPLFEQFARGSFGAYTTTETEWRWSKDGTESTENSETVPVMFLDIYDSEAIFEYVRYYGQGISSTPGVLAQETVGPNQTILLFTEESIPLPFHPGEWNQILSLTDANHDHRTAKLDVEGNLKFVPILDFHDSFRYP